MDTFRLMDILRLGRSNEVVLTKGVFSCRMCCMSFLTRGTAVAVSAISGTFGSALRVYTYGVKVGREAGGGNRG